MTCQIALPFPEGAMAVAESELSRSICVNNVGFTEGTMVLAEKRSLVPHHLRNIDYYLSLGWCPQLGSHGTVR